MAIKLNSTWDTATTNVNGTTVGTWGILEYPIGVPERVELTTALTRAGAKAIKLRLEKNDPDSTFGNRRVEYVYNAIDVNIDPTLRWYKWSAYYPSATYIDDEPPEIFCQWHERPTNGRSGSTSPCLALNWKEGKLFVEVRYSTQDYIDFPASRVTINPSIPVVPQPKDQWVDWIVYYDPQTDSSGRIKIWMNNTLLLDYTGPCAYIGSVFPYWKIGLYKYQWMPSWTFPPLSTTTVREFYFDEVLVADGKDEGLMRFLMPDNKLSYSDLNESLGFARNAATSFGQLRALSSNPSAASIGAMRGLSSKTKTIANFTTSGTWNCPVGVTSITVECWGGGGGGGRATGNPSAGGGGAGGAYARKVVAVTPGNNYTVTVGAGGNGTTPTAGGDTWFSTSSTVIAKGGAAGGSATTDSSNGAKGLGSSTGCIGDVIYKGGDGGPGNFTSSSGRSGAGGASGNWNAPGQNAVNGTRASGIDPGGDGGTGVNDNSTGNNGSNYASGGSGGKANDATDRNGGSGAGGYLRISY